MSEPARTQLLAAYADEHRDHLGALRALLAAGASGDLEDAYRHAHSLKGAARAVNLAAVVHLAHALESLVEAWWEGRSQPDAETIRLAGDALDAIEDLSALLLAGQPAPPSHPTLATLSEALRTRGLLEPADAAVTPMPPPVQAPSGPLPAAGTLRVDAAAANRLAASTSALLTELERQRAGEGALRRLSTAAMALMEEGDGGDWRRALSTVVERHGEALRQLEECSWAVARASEALAEDVARLRLVAADALLGGYGPMVRQLAAEMGKRVAFEVEGLATQADRDVLASVAEAAVHLLRNAVVHGLEAPEERRAAGKDEVGTLRLNVGTVGPRLSVRVIDDGRGIDTVRLAEQAVARGVMTVAQAARAAPDRLRQLIFLPGLSTAHQLTTAAGRGMGMPIVRRLVDRLQGSVVLNSAPGHGTEVVLSVPVNALVQRLLLVETRGQVFCLPTPAVARVACVPPESVQRHAGELLAVFDDGEVTLADLGLLLGLPGESRRGHDLWVAIVHGAGELVGLVVDGLVDVRDLPVAPLDPALVDDLRLVGTVTLERGELALVLSPAALRVHGTSAASVLAQPVKEPAPPLVLVVDDSVTTRTLERSILEAHGYRVEMAVDGRDALERMARRPPDLVVSDIEMPRLDGFGLLAAIRGEPRWARLPVVLVSSRGAAADRERGMSLGADAYIVKTRFDQDELLRVVGRLT